MSHRALIVYGGWDGHQPREVADLMARVLSDQGELDKARVAYEAALQLDSLEEGSADALAGSDARRGGQITPVFEATDGRGDSHRRYIPSSPARLDRGVAGFGHLQPA